MEASSHLIAIVHERGKELHQFRRHRDDIRQCEKNYHLEGFFLRSKGIFFFLLGGRKVAWEGVTTLLVN